MSKVIAHSLSRSRSNQLSVSVELVFGRDRLKECAITLLISRSGQTVEHLRQEMVRKSLVRTLAHDKTQNLAPPGCHTSCHFIRMVIQLARCIENALPRLFWNTHSGYVVQDKRHRCAGHTSQFRNIFGCNSLLHEKSSNYKFIAPTRIANWCY